MARWLVVVMVAFAVDLVVDTRDADACTCGKSSSCSAYWEADVVFIGQATTVKSHPQFHIEYVNGKPVTVLDGGGTESAVFVVEQTLRGIVAPKQLVKGLAGCGLIELEDKERYLVFANRQQNGELLMQACGETKELAMAREDLAYIRSIPTRKLVNLSGQVGTGDTAPASRVTISVRGTKLQTTSDAYGYFKIDVPPGTSVLEVRDAQLKGALSVTAATPGMCKWVNVDARWTGAVRGRVVDHNNVPVVGMRVVATPNAPKHYWSSESMSGADGRFEIGNLKPGIDVLVSTEQASPSLQRPYETVYHPGSSSESRAQAVPVPTTGATTNIELKRKPPVPIFDSTVIVRDARNRATRAKVSIQLFDNKLTIETAANGRGTFRHVAGEHWIEACIDRRGSEVCTGTRRTLTKPAKIELRIK